MGKWLSFLAILVDNILFLQLRRFSRNIFPSKIIKFLTHNLWVINLVQRKFQSFFLSLTRSFLFSESAASNWIKDQCFQNNTWLISRFCPSRGFRQGNKLTKLDGVRTNESPKFWLFKNDKWQVHLGLYSIRWPLVQFRTNPLNLESILTTVLRQRLTHFNSAQNLKMRQSLACQSLACQFLTAFSEIFWSKNWQLWILGTF